MLLANLTYTAESQTEANGWFAQLDAQLAALKAGTASPLPDWYTEGIAAHDPQLLSMAHSTEAAPTPPFIWCRTEVTVPDPEP